jgi:hypothetical protein
VKLILDWTKPLGLVVDWSDFGRTLGRALDDELAELREEVYILRSTEDGARIFVEMERDDALAEVARLRALVGAIQLALGPGLTTDEFAAKYLNDQGQPE